MSVGTAVSHSAIDWRLLVGALLGVTLAITLWRTYFDAIAVAVEERLREATGDDRTRMARDVFTYLHLPAVVGIVGMAVGFGVTLDQVALSSHDLPGIAVATLYGGAVSIWYPCPHCGGECSGRPASRDSCSPDA